MARKKTKALQEFQRNRIATATTITKRHPCRDDIWIEDYTRRWLVTDNMPSNREYDDKANRSADEEIRKSKCMTSVMHNNHRFSKLSKNAKYNSPTRNKNEIDEQMNNINHEQCQTQRLPNYHRPQQKQNITKWNSKWNI